MIFGLAATRSISYYEKEVGKVSAYNELVKNFERIRAYMREFYVYGFKSREEYNRKSARTYDDERRRMESWLGDYMSFARTPEGKNVFLSVDSRVSQHNPFYKAFKAKSFTDGDITLHFLLLDLLSAPETALSLAEILERIDAKLSLFTAPMVFDESTVRKKLKEYIEQGIVIGEKHGRKLLYHRAPDVPIDTLTDVLNFYSEVAPCGVVGSYLLDKQERTPDRFGFKHHYITSAIDSIVAERLFCAMREKRFVTVRNMSRRSDEPRENKIVPLRIFISVQNGRQHLLAYQPDFDCIKSFRMDYLSDVKLGAPCENFDALRSELSEMQGKMWGVTASRNRLEHVEFTVCVAPHEGHIINRLEREKRIGTVEKLSDSAYRFSADVYDIGEMIPWIRTFICRITDLRFSNKALEAQFKHDLDELYRMYGLEEVEA